MPKYSKKPVVVEAHQLTIESAQFIMDWIGKSCNGTLTVMNEPMFMDGKKIQRIELIVETLEGRMIARDGDWIIKGIQDEFYPCKAWIFEQTYEVVEE